MLIKINHRKGEQEYIAAHSSADVDEFSVTIRTAALDKVTGDQIAINVTLTRNEIAWLTRQAAREI